MCDDDDYDNVSDDPECPSHRPIRDADLGWYCAACGAEAPPDAEAPGPGETIRSGV